MDVSCVPRNLFVWILMSVAVHERNIHWFHVNGTRLAAVFSGTGVALYVDRNKPSVEFLDLHEIWLRTRAGNLHDL